MHLRSAFNRLPERANNLMFGFLSHNMDTLMISGCPTCLVIVSSELSWLTSTSWLSWSVWDHDYIVDNRHNMDTISLHGLGDTIAIILGLIFSVYDADLIYNSNLVWNDTFSYAPMMGIIHIPMRSFRVRWIVFIEGMMIDINLFIFCWGDGIMIWDSGIGLIAILHYRDHGELFYTSVLVMMTSKWSSRSLGTGGHD